MAVLARAPKPADAVTARYSGNVTAMAKADLAVDVGGRTFDPVVVHVLPSFSHVADWGVPADVRTINHEAGGRFPRTGLEKEALSKNKK